MSDTAHEGGCACGQLRYRLLRAPMFVHCCHCTRCQRETGGPYAHHAMIEFSAFEVTAGTADYLRVPTDSGATHWVARCAGCGTVLWNEYGARGRAVTHYVRVGTLDEPGRLPPQAHIYTRSAQAWQQFDKQLGDQFGDQSGKAPGFKTWYDAAKLWPAASLARYSQAKALRAEEAVARKAAAKPARAPAPTPTSEPNKAPAKGAANARSRAPAKTSTSTVAKAATTAPFKAARAARRKAPPG